jgi:hypothetical protein
VEGSGVTDEVSRFVVADIESHGRAREAKKREDLVPRERLS